MSGEQTAADLRAAADILRRDGWTQGTLQDGNGCRCAMGAILAAITTKEPDEAYEKAELDRYDAAWTTLGNHTGQPAVAAWNDDPRRTADEVIAAFEAAAATVTP